MAGKGLRLRRERDDNLFLAAGKNILSTCSNTYIEHTTRQN